MAANGENGRESYEFSYLVEHLGLLPWLFLIIYGVSSHSSSPNLIKFVIFSCSYWYIENIHFILINPKPNPHLNRKKKHKRIGNSNKSK